MHQQMNEFSNPPPHTHNKRITGYIRNYQLEIKMTYENLSKTSAMLSIQVRLI